MANTFARPAAAALLVALAVTVPAPAHASAAPATTAATSCYGGAVTVSTDDSLEFGPYTSSARCNDINVRIVGGDADSVNACVKFVRYGQCNYWTNVGWGWKTIATDVLDGSRFTVPLGVDLEGATARVQIAY
ncbi:hypothetical protein ABZX90_26310 [Streptomyces sp. NPDC002935]|uniref:hypothetical protein n=1 Tax=Streptomyces sp. NPDC002935 TaxID=3154545 RepID=UPI0033B4D270